MFDPIMPGIPTIKYSNIEPSLYDNDDDFSGYHSDPDHPSGDISSNPAIICGFLLGGIVVFVMFVVGLRSVRVVA